MSMSMLLKSQKNYIIIIIIIVIIKVIIIKMFNRHILALKMNYSVFTKFRKSQKIILGLGLQND